MKHSKRDSEGYLMIDHKWSPGLEDSLTIPAGLPPGAGHGFFETSFNTCSHCQAMIINNPGRTRQRGYCPKCDKYLCDACEYLRASSGGDCRSFSMVMDKILESAIQDTLIKEI